MEALLSLQPPYITGTLTSIRKEKSFENLRFHAKIQQKRRKSKTDVQSYRKEMSKTTEYNLIDTATNVGQTVGTAGQPKIIK